MPDDRSLFERYLEARIHEARHFTDRAAALVESRKLQNSPVAAEELKKLEASVDRLRSAIQATG